MAGANYFSCGILHNILNIQRESSHHEAGKRPSKGPAEARRGSTVGPADGVGRSDCVRDSALPLAAAAHTQCTVRLLVAVATVWQYEWLCQVRLSSESNGAHA